MHATKLRRGIALVALAGLVMSAYAGPAEAKKKKKPKPCPAFVPWTNAADASILKVTPKHTEAAPLEAAVTTDPGLGFSTTETEDPPESLLPAHAWQNIQVDPTTKTTKLWIVLEFNPLFDYDLYVRDTAGTSVFHANGFNQAPEGPLAGAPSGGHSEMGAEWIDGPIVLDCTGFSLDIVSSTTTGGDVTLRLWLSK